MINLLLLKKMVIKLNKKLYYWIDIQIRKLAYITSTLKLITIRSFSDSFFPTLCGR